MQKADRKHNIRSSDILISFGLNAQKVIFERKQKKKPESERSGNLSLTFICQCLCSIIGNL